MKIYSEDNDNLIGYILNSSNNVLTFDTITVSALNMYYDFTVGVTYKIKISGPIGSYTIKTSNNIGKHVIKSNSTEEFERHIVYEHDEEYEGYFTNTEDAKDFVDTLRTTSEEMIYDAVICVISGVILSGPYGIIVDTACTVSITWESVKLNDVLIEINKKIK